MSRKFVIGWILAWFCLMFIGCGFVKDMGKGFEKGFGDEEFAERVEDYSDKNKELVKKIEKDIEDKNVNVENLKEIAVQLKETGVLLNDIKGKQFTLGELLGWVLGSGALIFGGTHSHRLKALLALFKSDKTTKNKTS